MPLKHFLFFDFSKKYLRKRPKIRLIDLWWWNSSYWLFGETDYSILTPYFRIIR
jgi:hypothetical protein